MNTININETTQDHNQQDQKDSRRDFLMLTAGAMGAVAIGSVCWPLIDQMNPDASALAVSKIEVDISQVQPGQILTVKWRGKPVFIRNRTPAEIAKEAATPIHELKDHNETPRTHPQHANILVVVGVCTHLGCIPLGHQGPYNGWFCPCHGSVYDTCGRIISGPAPTNLEVPNYEFVTDKLIRIG